MPTRWLSIRKRNPLLHNEPTAEPTAKQQEFDFAFGESPSAGQSASGRIVGPRLVQIRPTTSGSPTGKRKLRVEVPAIRPRTSENHKPSPLQNVNGVSRSEDSLIGLAFGSPSHPPAFFCAPPEEPSTIEHNTILRQHPEIPDHTAQMHSKRWRKLGTLFKSRQAAVRRDEVPSGPTIGLPTGFVVLDKDPATETPIVEGDKLRPTQSDHPRRQAPPAPIEKDQKSSALKTADLVIQKPEDDTISRPSTATTMNAESAGEPYTRPPLPKLELDISFNLPAAKRSSSLLARRSKALDSLKSFDDSRPTTKGTTTNGEHDDHPNPDSEPLTPLMPPRRLTTPTMTRSPAASKYSLFPTTSPAPVKIHGRVPSSDRDHLPAGQLRRSATSPARLSPMQDHFSSVPRPEPLNPNKIALNEQAIHSPEDNTASTDRSAPWSSAHSFQSSVSSATTVDEIFFDIKSFRDSKGVEDGQFVMTRPDSAQVELARTRSKRVPAPSHLRHVEASAAAADEAPERTTPIPPEPQAASSGAPSAWTTKHTSINTAYFDEAIAAVERLTTPTGNADSAIEKVPSIPTVMIANHDEKPHQPTPIVTVQHSRPSDHHARLATSKTHEEVGRLIPSPVVEVKEDDSPRPNTSPVKASATSSPVQQPPQTAAARGVTPRVAAIKRVDRPIDDSPTIPQGPPSPKRTAKQISSPAEDDKPPPVPKKDAKFIPLSKYAAKSTVTAIEQRSGVTPTRPVRANTEDLALRSGASPRVSKERSATLPSSLQPRAHARDVVHKASLRGLEKAIPPRQPNPVASNPVTAEVAVARTVSLSRKQSARILVPGPKLAARRAEAQAQAQAQTQAQAKPQAQASLSQSRLQVAPQPQRHVRNPSSTSQKSNKSQHSFLGGSGSGHRHKRTASSTRRASKDLIGGGGNKNTTSTITNTLKVTKTQPSGGTFGKFLWSRESEKQLIKEARKWEILEKKSYSPVVVQAERGHRPGVSVGLIVESV
ncbi:uncharacterized protein Z519_04064 [Cladophialophora bantiana CBS 173.52]|uniref:Uncharacterized protein n=1 Tax=Cladophialophora bantiana (strain ATCC 10958 / CBS 173.52 / CDC B-1940 / NIH 8579) TaxID=1442370 RepID=A0A0D2IFD1_CLAB1|nr:uncharacterized protein Z519_04064 [Cladophialophora bantiana CBS 173.52]KIW95479.1 hypothetical protein Z519_04064 [Cladophialophora bantiana CBS 173.52]